MSSERPTTHSEEKLNPTTTRLQKQLAEILGIKPEQLQIDAEDKILTSTSLGQHLSQGGWFTHDSLPQTFIRLMSLRQITLEAGKPISPHLTFYSSDICFIECIDLSSLKPENILNQPPRDPSYPYTTFAYEHPTSEDIASHFLPPTQPSQTHPSLHF
jgi:hypothetical protein